MCYGYEHTRRIHVQNVRVYVSGYTHALWGGGEVDKTRKRRRTRIQKKKRQPQAYNQALRDGGAHSVM